MMPLLFLPIALFRGRWKTAVATLAVLAGTSWLYFQRFPADWRIFTDTNADPRPTLHVGNQGLMALLYALSGEQARIYMLYRNLTIGLVGALLIWLTYCAWRGNAESRRRNAELRPSDSALPTKALLYLYAAASAGYLLCYKDVWEHHYVLLLPPLVRFMSWR